MQGTGLRAINGVGSDNVGNLWFVYSYERVCIIEHHLYNIFLGLYITNGS